MWDHCNRVAHNNETGVRAIELRRAIREQFYLGSQGATVQARRLFQGGVQKVLGYSIEAKEAWGDGLLRQEAGLRGNKRTAGAR